MIGAIIRFIVGVLFIPVAVASTMALYHNMVLSQVLSANMRFFLWGMATYVILHIFFYKPTTAYVLGHEAVHAATAWVFGGKIKSFKVSEEGGSVATDKSNFVIDLAPYFVPVYAIIIVVVYFVVSMSYRIHSGTFIFLIGLTLAFHLISTIEILKIRQPDIVKSGYLFSIVLVYTVNLAVVALVFGAVFAEFNAKRYFLETFFESKAIYVAVVRQLFMR